VNKEEYSKFKTNNLLSNYFGGSAEKMMSFFIKEKKIDLKQMDELLKSIKNE
jgi:predicted transcriptional regulator